MVAALDLRAPEREPSPDLARLALIPAGYRSVPVSQCTEAAHAPGSAAAWRWIPCGDAPATLPLAIDVTVTLYDRRSSALRAVTRPPELPDPMLARPLFLPRIGDESSAVRGDAVEDGQRYALYRVDCVRGLLVVTVSAVWRWPAGSPNWVYERAGRILNALGGNARVAPSV